MGALSENPPTPSKGEKGVGKETIEGKDGARIEGMDGNRAQTKG
jgi:hypothetical protein